jgi:hypothetical protein
MHAVAAVVSVVAVLATPAPDARLRAQLAVVDATPLTIKGTGFQPGERVKLVLFGPAALSRIVRAGVRGGFTAPFRIDIGRCDPLLVRATGTLRSRAVLDLTQTACAPRP